MLRVIINYRYVRDGELYSFSYTIYNKLNNNTNFIFPDGTIDTFLQEIKTYNVIYATRSANNTRTNTQQKNDARDVVLARLRSMAIMVNQQGEGNKEVLLSSGFKLTKTKNDKVPLEKAKIIEMKPGKTSGVLLITLKSCSEARSYLCYLSKVPMPASTDDMKLHVSSSPSFEITGLEKLTEYVCIAANLGADDEKAYSEPKIGNTI